VHVTLWAIKLAHTVIWAFLAGCILALPVAALKHKFRIALWLSVIVLVECGVLALNQGRCPLSNLAASYTADCAANFDIYLPRWLAQYNKVIFGTIFVVNELIVLWCGIMRRPRTSSADQRSALAQH